MAFRLTAAILESHGAGPALAGRDGELSVPRADDVLLGSDEAPIAVALLERAGLGAVRVRAALADGGRVADASGADAPGAEPAFDWRRAALELGLRLPRAGHGDLDALHRERLAAPGRLALCAGPLASCGAFGMLALGTDVLAAAAVLAGGALDLGTPRALGVELTGVLPTTSGGADLALALLARLRGVGGTVDVVELGGPGIASLAMPERIGTAWLMAQAGMPALFPSDDATRAELALQGRDEDWRRVDAVPAEAGPDWSVDLTTLEPRIAPAEAIAEAQPLRDRAGTPIERVLVGPAATVADLARLAARLEGRRVHERVECTVTPGSRRLLDRATALGVTERLLACGVRLTESPLAIHAAGSAAGLCCGVPPAGLTGGRARWWIAGIEACAAAALAGAVALPQEAERPAEVTIVAPEALDADPWIAAERGAAAHLRSRPVPHARGRPRGAFRGEVLAALGDDVECASLLPPGARLEALGGRLRALAGHLLAVVEPGFAARARERNGGVIVAGERFGRGAPRATVAVCLAEASVWAVLARSYAPGVAGALVDAGVLPLLLTAGPAPQCGDELELPGLPEALVPERPLPARDLTRAVHLTLGHERSGREVAILRAGGRMPFVLETGAAGR
jgi:aconitate hydratase